MRAYVIALSLAFALVLPLRALGPVPPGASHVEKGIRFYRNCRYKDALAEFMKAWRLGVRDGRLEYNIGNCHFRLGRVAMALAYYMRALSYMPRDGDVLANIRLCRKILGLEESTTIPFVRDISNAVSSFTVSEMVVLCSVFSLLLFASLALRRITRLPVFSWTAGIALIGFLVFLGQFLWRITERKEEAIVISREARLFSEPVEKLKPVAILRAGVQVEVLSTEGKWAYVETSERKGWLKSKELKTLDWRKE